MFEGAIADQRDPDVVEDAGRDLGPVGFPRLDREAAKDGSTGWAGREQTTHEPPGDAVDVVEPGNLGEHGGITVVLVRGNDELRQRCCLLADALVGSDRLDPDGEGVALSGGESRERRRRLGEGQVIGHTNRISTIYDLWGGEKTSSVQVHIHTL